MTEQEKFFKALNEGRVIWRTAALNTHDGNCNWETQYAVQKGDTYCIVLPEGTEVQHP